MNEHVYLHDIGNPHYLYVPEDQRKVLEEILDSGYLLSRRMQGKTSSRGFAGLDYISLCDYTLRDLCNSPMYNGYHQYIKNSLAVGFPKESLDVIEPTIIDPIGTIIDGHEYMRILGNATGGRYSDLPDEIQVKDMVDMEKMTLVTFPTRYYLDDSLFTNKTILFKRLRKELEEVNKILAKYNYEVPVYDIESGTLLNEENAYRLVIKYKDKK